MTRSAHSSEQLNAGSSYLPKWFSQLCLGEALHEPVFPLMDHPQSKRLFAEWRKVPGPTTLHPHGGVTTHLAWMGEGRSENRSHRA